MIRLWYSNYLEHLVEALIESVCPADMDPFETRTVVVPNRNLETYLKLEIARHRGISANIEFLFLNNFLRRLAPRDGKLLGREQVRGLLLDHILSTGDPDLVEVEAYLEAASDDEDRDKRAFQLADRVSRFFEEYELSRPEMIARWDVGTLLTNEPYASTERWQRALWLKVFGPEGSVKKMPGTLRNLRLGEFLKQAMSDPNTLPTPVHFFGLSYLARQYYDVLGKLSERGNLHIYALNPCMEFWEDLPSEWRVRRARRFKKRKENEPLLGFRDDRETLFAHEEDPVPLRLWGEPGRNHIQLLNRLSECDFEGVFHDPLVDGDSLLHQIQHDIYARTPIDETHKRPYDDSLIVLECPTIQREVEIVASEIWRVMRDSHKTERPLRFNDIAVIINPEDREAYQSHIRAVFRDTWSIPHNIIDITASQNRRFIEAVHLLLNLPFGNFKRDELLRLMTHVNVLAQHPDIRVDDWVRWIDSLQVFFGADSQDFEGTYIEKELFHWDQGLKRLVLGTLMFNDPENPQIYPAQAEYLPYTTSPSEIASVARLVRLARELVEQTRRFQTLKQPLNLWYQVIAAWISRTLVPADEEDELDLTRVLRAIEDLQNQELSTVDVSYRVAFESVNVLISQLEISRGQYLAEGVVVSSFIPMRPIPFRIVFITGLGERHFPRMDVRSPLDLRWATSQWWDNFSNRRADEYMFLETLISTRERLVLSFVARDSHTGETMMPSSVVRELDFMLRRHYLDDTEFQKLHRVHPLRRFDPLYFDGSESLLNVHPEALKEAQASAMRALGRVSGSPEIRQLLGEVDIPKGEPEAQEIEITLRQVRRFLENPLQGTAEFYLGLHRFEDADYFAVETETFVSPAARENRMLQDLFVSAWHQFGAALDDHQIESMYDDRVLVEELKGTVPTGLFLRADRQRHLRLLATWWHNLRAAGIESAPTPVVYNFGQARERHAAVHFVEPLEFEVLRPHGKVRVLLGGKTYPLLSQERMTVKLGSATRFHEKSDEYQFMSGFLDAMVLASANLMVPGDWRVLMNGGAIFSNSNMRAFENIKPAEARQWIQTLLESMLEGVHSYQFPLDSAFDFALREDRQAKPFERIVPHSSLLSGPIHRSLEARRYRIPEMPELGQLIESRLGPYLKHRIPQT